MHAKSTKNLAPNNTWINALGWYGVIATVLAYILVSFSAFSPTGLIYQGLNFSGALGITIETYYKKDYQPLWLNFIWMLIALVAIGKMIILVTR